MYIEIYRIKTKYPVPLSVGGQLPGLQKFLVRVDDEIYIQADYGFIPTTLTLNYISLNPHIFEQIA